MTSDGYSNWGEEWAQKYAWRQDQITRDTSLEVLLYDDSSDSISDSDDVGAVNTEPDDGNYARQPVTLDGSEVSLSQESGDIRASATVTFDVTDTTGTVDASMTVVDFTSDIVNSEGSQNTHHVYSAMLDIGDTDLSQFTSLDVTVQLDLN